MFLIFTYSPTPFFPSAQFSLIQLPVLRLEYHALHHVTSPLITLCISYIHLHIERTKLGWYAWLQACVTSGYGWRKRARTRGEAAKDILLIAFSPFLPRLRCSFAPQRKLPSTLASMTMWNHNVYLIKNKKIKTYLTKLVRPNRSCARSSHIPPSPTIFHLLAEFLYLFHDWKFLLEPCRVGRFRSSSEKPQTPPFVICIFPEMQGHFLQNTLEGF